MKKFLVLFLVISWISNTGYSQEFKLQGVDCNGFSTPKVLLKGATLKSECDSIFLVNPDRMKLYSEAVRLVLEIDTALFDREISALRVSLDRIAKKGALMQQDYDALETSYRHTIDEQQSALEQTQSELAVAEGDLRKERERIENIQDELDVIRKKGGRNNFLFGAGGVVVGFAGAFMIFN